MNFSSRLTTAVIVPFDEPEAVPVAVSLVWVVVLLSMLVRRVSAEGLSTSLPAPQLTRAARVPRVNKMVDVVFLAFMMNRSFNRQDYSLHISWAQGEKHIKEKEWII